jgi:hypothetical protein
MANFNAKRGNPDAMRGFAGADLAVTHRLHDAGPTGEDFAVRCGGPVWPS